MTRFDYHRASSVTEAVNLLAAVPSARAVAGGTNLVDLLKYDVEKPSTLVDINQLPLKNIEEMEAGGLRLGALVSNSDTADDPRVKKLFPLLSSAILAGATGQLRNAATDGGNLMQRTRCYYFYDVGTPCNKREPGTGCPAVKGVNRIHAILGTSASCIATHPSDMCVALSALEAVVIVQGPTGVRRIPFSEFHRLSGDTPQFDNTLKSGELIIAIEIAPQSFGSNWTYLKIRDRQSYAFALVSVAVGFEMNGQIVRRARFALGGVAHKPWRDTEAEAMLEDQPISRQLFTDAAKHVLRSAVGFGGNTFKIPLAERAMVRAFTQAAAGTPQPIAENRFL